MIKIDAPTNCVACGVSISQSGIGSPKEFCSVKCQKTGRAFCKACGKPITQPTRPQGRRKNFCNNICIKRYERVGEVKLSYIEERNRSECIVCGEPIRQTRYRATKYCSNRCNKLYVRTGRNKQSLTEDWGAYGPEVQKVLREVQLFMGIGAAKRLATAIDREYLRRRQT
jgi:predicted nucleic acid-binding Zn ribbon protein